MFYVTKDVLKKMSPEDQALIEDEGITMEEMDAMTPEEKEKMMGDHMDLDVKAPDEKEVPEGEGTASDDMSEKADDETKLPKALKYGDEDQFESKLTDDGRMEELPESKKNEIDGFDKAAEQGMALLEKMAKKPEKKPMPPMKKKPVNQDELDGETDE